MHEIGLTRRLNMIESKPVMDNLIEERETIIIGAGLSGMTSGALLRKRNLDFLILEASDEVGGTWRWTNYPGAGTDTEVMTYLPTFAPGNTKYKYATRDELFNYCIEFSQKYVGRDNIRFNCQVEELDYCSKEKKWRVKTNQGIYKARFIVHAIAGINIPKTVNFPGQELFNGTIIHSSKLGPELDFFKDKRVAIIGMGATTIQLAPSIVDAAQSVTVFRKTVPYVFKYKRKLAPKSPLTYKFYRHLFEIRNDLYTLFDGIRQLEFMLRWPLWIKEYFIRGRKLPPAAVPPISQPVHCTRRAFDYLGFMDCVKNKQINVVDVSNTNGISGFNEKGVLANGQLWEADVVILAIGFEIGQINHPVFIDGKLVPIGLVMDYRWNMFGTIPNFFLPAAGGPFFSVPPRIVEDNIPYLIKLIEHMHQHDYHEFRLGDKEIERAVKMNTLVMNFLNKHSVVFSPSCHSLRYIMPSMLTPDEEKTYKTIHTATERRSGHLMSPLPRVLTKLDMYFNFKLHKFSFSKEEPDLG
jgi:cation diffusion facilitator CzcD-associated flavoprotein CzcO